MSNKNFKGQKSQRDLINDVSAKYGIQTSKGTIYRVLQAKERILESMKNATKASKNKKRLINKERLEFEKLLDSTLKESFLTKNVNTALAKRVAENICHKHPEFQSCMQHIPFQQKYFLAFFKRYGWKWGQVKGTKKYYPKEVIEKEIERINAIMQSYQKKDIWNTDECSLVYQGKGSALTLKILSMSFSRRLKGTKRVQR